MKLLLDTHVLLWLFTNDSSLSDEARAMIGSSQNELYYSVASVWEVGIKYTIKPSGMPITDEDFVAYCDRSGIKMLGIVPEHIFMLKSLKREKDAPIHKDPFDRLLIAQAKCEGMNFLTHDKLLPYYKEECIVLV